MRDRLADELVELLGIDHPAGDQRRDALDRGEQDEADAVWLAGLQDAVGLALPDQLEHDREGAVGLVRRSAAASDTDVARRLWDVSEELTGVRFPLRTAAVV